VELDLVGGIPLAGGAGTDAADLGLDPPPRRQLDQSRARAPVRRILAIPPPIAR
jgi:hypothetical protein